MTTNPNFADRLDAETNLMVNDMFEYHKWDEDQIVKGAEIRTMLTCAVKSIIQHVPPCPDRSAAIRKLREARMDCNSAITHGGKY